MPGPVSCSGISLLLFAEIELHSYFPNWMSEYGFAGLTVAQWLELAAFLVIAYVLGLILQAVIVRILDIVARRTRVDWDEKLVALLPGPLQLFLTLFILAQLLPMLALEPEADELFQSILSSGLIIAVAWLLLRLLQLGGKLLVIRYTAGAENTPEARALRTQVSVAQTILRFIFILAAAALVMMQFEVARTIGVSLLASAGIAGIAIGFAAQRTVATLFAGIQLAFTRTVKIGDTVIVEGQFGFIEDIHLTYVVVRTWDLRRLIIPVMHFVENTIENWTISATDLMGTVFLYTDYTIPVDEIREEVKNILAESKLWDGKVQAVQVTNLTERSAEVRILVSALNGGDLFTLRCLIREKMLTWLQTRGKAHLPLMRLEVQGATVLSGEKENANLH